MFSHFPGNSIYFYIFKLFYLLFISHFYIVFSFDISAFLYNDLFSILCIYLQIFYSILSFIYFLNHFVYHSCIFFHFLHIKDNHSCIQSIYFLPVIIVYKDTESWFSILIFIDRETLAQYKESISLRARPPAEAGAEDEADAAVEETLWNFFWSVTSSLDIVVPPGRILNVS